MRKEREDQEEEASRDTYFVNKDRDELLSNQSLPNPALPQHEQYREVKIAKRNERDPKRILPLPRKIDIKNEYKLR